MTLTYVQRNKYNENMKTAIYGRPAQQMRTLYFCPVVSSFYFLLLFSSPILSHRRLDVDHTSTHGVALVRI